MSGASNIAVTITGVDHASKTIDAVRKRIASMHEPVERASRSMERFNDAPALAALGKDLRNVAEHSLKAFEGITRLSGGLQTLAGAASIAGLSGLVNETARFAQQLGFTAQRAGLSASQLSDLQGAARIAGSSAEALSSGMVTLTDNLTNAAQGRAAPEFLAVLDQLKIKLRDGRGQVRSAASVFPELAEGISRINNPTVRAFYAITLLGGAGENLLPMMSRGARGVIELTDAAHRLNPVTQQNIESADRLRDAQARLGLATKNIADQITLALEPALTPLLLGLGDWIQKNPRIAEGTVLIGGAITSLITVLGLLRAAWWAVAGAATLAARAEATAAGAGVAGAAGVAGGGMLSRLLGLVPLLGLGFVGPAGGEDPAFSERKNQEFLANRRAGAARLPDGQRRVLARQAFDQLRALGWSAEAAAGLVAQMDRESGFNINAVGDGGAAIGLGQWHPDRRANFARIMGHDISQSTFAEQIRFIDWELRNTEAGAGRGLAGVSSPYGAGVIGSTRYERPADPFGIEADLRGRLAQRYFDEFRAPAQGVGAPESGISGGTGAPSSDTKVTGAATLNINLGGQVPPGTTTSTNATGDLWAAPPRVERVLPVP